MTTAERYGIVLGVVGFVLSLANLAWTVWAWWVQNRVRLHPEVSIRVDRRGILLVANLVNDGGGPLFIERVALESARAAEGTGGALPSLPMNPDPIPPGGRKAPLTPGEGREYVLVRDLRLKAMGDIRNSRQYHYWISVRTPKREVLKINDVNFLETLKTFADDTPPSPGATFG